MLALQDGSVRAVVTCDDVDHVTTRSFYPGKTRRRAPALTVVTGTLHPEGQIVASHAGLRGTQEGAFLGVPASGKSREMRGLATCKVVNGVSPARRGAVHLLELCMRLGVRPDELQVKGWRR